MKNTYINYLATALHTDRSAIAVCLEREIKRLPYPELEILYYFYRLAAQGRLMFCDGRLNIKVRIQHPGVRSQNI